MKLKSRKAIIRYATEEVRSVVFFLKKYDDEGKLDLAMLTELELESMVSLATHAGCTQDEAETIVNRVLDEE